MKSAARSTALFVATCASLASCEATNVPNRSAVNNDASSRIYVAYCASCHGEDGRGLPDLGFNLVGNAFIRTSSNAELREFLMIGRRPGSPDSKMDLLMPAFDYLTDEELNAAIAQLRHLNGG